MATNDHRFISHWRVEGTLHEVADIIANATEYPRWWPAFCLDARELEPGDERGLGRVVEIRGKGWLPYTLRWAYRTTAVRYPYGSTSEVFGELNGRGDWTFRQDGPYVDLTLDWIVRADKRSLRLLSPLLKPLFRSNHRWDMRRGEISLRLELARRRARTAEERAAVPAPPKPLWPARRRGWSVARHEGTATVR